MKANTESNPQKTNQKKSPVHPTILSPPSKFHKFAPKPGTPDQWHNIAQSLTTARASAAEKILAGWKFGTEIAWFLCHVGTAIKHWFFDVNSSFAP